MAEEKKKKPKCKQCEEAKQLVKKLKDNSIALIAIILVFFLGISIAAWQIIFYDIPSFWFSVSLSLIVFCFFAFLWHYIPYRLIGKYIYYFKNKDGTIHYHREKPIWIKDLKEYCWKTPPKNVAEWDAKDFLVSGPIIRIKVGGWFRKPTVIPNTRGLGIVRYKHEYRVYKNRKRGFNLHTKFPFKSSIYGIPIYQIMQLIEQFDSIDSILEAAVYAREERERNEELANRLSTSTEQIFNISKTRGFLIREMLSRLVQIHQNKSMGRSKHARDLRQSIENTIRELPNRRALIEGWLDHFPKGKNFVPQLLDRFDQEELEKQQPQKKAANA